MYKENWENFPKIEHGNRIRITWDESYYGNQEEGVAIKEGKKTFILFGDKKIHTDSIRENEHIERTEIIK